MQYQYVGVGGARGRNETRLVNRDSGTRAECPGLNFQKFDTRPPRDSGARVTRGHSGDIFLFFLIK